MTEINVSDGENKLNMPQLVYYAILYTLLFLLLINTIIIGLLNKMCSDNQDMAVSTAGCSH